MRRKRVVLPAPLGPTNPTRSPFRRCQLRPRNSSCPPKDSETLISCNITSDASLAGHYGLEQIVTEVEGLGTNGCSMRFRIQVIGSSSIVRRGGSYCFG